MYKRQCEHRTRHPVPHRSSSRQQARGIDRQRSFCIWAVYRRKHRYYARDQTAGPTRMGMLQSIQAGTVRYVGCPVCSEVAHADGNPAVRVRDVDPGQEALRSLSCERHTEGFSYGSLASSADNAQTTSCRTPRPLRRHNCESVETTIRKRRLLFAGAVQRTHNERLGDVWDDGWWGESGTRPTIKELGPMSSRRPQGVSSHRGIHGKHPLGVWCRNGAMAHGG